MSWDGLGVLSRVCSCLSAGECWEKLVALRRNKSTDEQRMNAETNVANIPER